MREPFAGRRWLWLVPPLVAGMVLRLWNVRDQILGGDELHAVRAAVTMPLSQVLVTYRQADNCIPLTAFYRLLIDSGIRLSELILRLPMLASGIALLAVLPFLLARRVEQRTAIAFAWLLALSPALVLYSRIVRSYMPMLLLASAAVLAFDAWWRPGGQRRRRYAVAYVVLATLAIWFHLGSAPFVAAPFVFALGDLLVGKREDRAARGRDLALLATLLAAGLAVFLVPAWPSLAHLIATKRQAQSIPWSTLGAILRLQAGSGNPLVAVLFWGLALAGAFLLLRRHPRLGAYSLTLAVCQLVGILILSPVGLGHPWVFSRYLIPVLPFVLLWLAFALTQVRLPHPSRAGALGAGLLAPAFLVLLAVAGPFADRGFRDSSFMHHDDMAGFYFPRAAAPLGATSPFYLQLAGERGARSQDSVVEYPWLFLWRFRTFYVYQETHHRRVVVATPQRLVRQPGLALRNALPPDPEALCASGAGYLIVHLHIAREEDRIVRPTDKAAPALTRDLRRSLRTAAEHAATDLAARWGPPLYADADIRVWDLRQACAAIVLTGPTGPAGEPPA